MRNADALRDTRGARGVDDIGQVVRTQPGCALDIGDRRFAEARGLVQQYHRNIGRRNVAQQIGCGQHTDRLRVGEHELESLRRVGDVDRQISGTGGEYTEQCDGQLLGPADGNGDQRFGPRTARHQCPCHLVRASLQFTETQCDITESDRDRIRTAARLRLDEIDQRHIGHVRPCRIPFVQYEFAFAGGEQIDIAQYRFGIGRYRRQHPQEAIGEILDGGGVEKVGGVGEGRRHTSRRGVLRHLEL